MWAPTSADLDRATAITPAAAPHHTSHPDFGPVRYESIERAGDDEQATADTIRIMARVVREDSQHPTIRAIAAAAAGAGGDPIGGIFRWVKSHVRFREDADAAAGLRGFNPADTEVLIRPVDLVRMPRPSGDCDDFSMLTAALLRAVGIPAAFVTIAADPSAPDTYSHVYVMAGRTPVDSSHGPAPGWSAPAAGKSRRWEIDDVITPTRQLGNTAWWQDLVKIGAQGGIDIAKMYSTPTGYYQQTGPNGTSITTRQTSAPPFSIPDVGGGIGTSTLLLVVIGGALLFMVARK
jgi:transglutaminase-like putative cysteine protease